MTERVDRPASLVRNTVARSAGSLTGYILSFVSAPIILEKLGLRMFGIWALTGALAQYAGLLDLGVGISLERYIAAHAEDRRACGQFIAIGWLSVVAIAVVLCPIAVLGAAPLSRALGGISVRDMHVVLYSSLVLLSCSMLTAVVASFPTGRRRMVVPNIGYTIGAVINFSASVGSLALGARLPGYALANAGAGVLTLCVVVALVIHAEGPLPLARPRVRRVREFLSFSIRTQLVRIGDLVNYQTDKVVIAFAVGPAAAGAYEIANRVAIATREMGIFVTSAVSVELTAVMARSGLNAVRARYGRLTEVAAALSFPPVLLAMATAPLLMNAWLSHSPPYAIPVLVALAGAYLAAVSTGVSYAVAVAAGEPGIVAKASVAASLANIVLTVALAPLFGIWGVLAGTVIALTCGAIGQVVLVHRRFSLPAASYLHAVGPALTTYVLLAVPIAAISYGHFVHSRVAEAVLFVLLGLAYLGACGAWVVKAGRLPAAVLSRLPKIVWLRSSPGRDALPTSAEPMARLAAQGRGHSSE